jgi:pyrroloquinoline quinone (PQQ) biosynthesis protein C
MNDEETNVILKRILAHFEEIAPKIVKESIDSLSTDHPVIDYYDIDYYMGKMEGAFDDVDEERLRTITFENIEAINAIFFKYYKEARADNY